MTIEEVQQAMGTVSKITAFRHLKKLNYLTSYTHSCRYYTLKELAEFDEDGLWRYEEIGFSKYGTLKDHFLHLIREAPLGKMHAEFPHEQKTSAHNALLDLVKAAKIARKEVDGVYVYTDIDPKRSAEQLENRRKLVGSAPPEWMVIQILVAILQATPGYVLPETIAKKLSQKKSSITLEQIRWVFQQYGLEKKARTFPPRRANTSRYKPDRWSFHSTFIYQVARHSSCI